MNLKAIARAFGTTQYVSTSTTSSARHGKQLTKRYACEGENNFPFTDAQKAGRYVLNECGQFNSGGINAIVKNCDAIRLPEPFDPDTQAHLWPFKYGYIASQAEGYNSTFVGCAVGAVQADLKAQGNVVLIAVFGTLGGIVGLVALCCCACGISNCIDRRRERSMRARVQQRMAPPPPGESAHVSAA